MPTHDVSMSWKREKYMIQWYDKREYVNFSWACFNIWEKQRQGLCGLKGEGKNKDFPGNFMSR